MRMTKRIAVGILAAAMALSLMTACSGGGSSSGGFFGGGGSHNSGNTGGSDNGSGNNSGNKTDLTPSKDLTKLDDDTEIKYADSQTAKWNRAQASGKWYMKTEQDNRSIVTEQVRDGRKTYTKGTYEDGTFYENLYDGEKSYRLYRNPKIAVISVWTGSTTSSGETYKFTSVQKTTRVIENVPYYAEKMTYTGEQTGKTMNIVYCYDSTGKQVYVIYHEGTSDQYMTHVLSYGTSIPGDAILEIPSDWSVYTMTYDGNTTTVTDASGRQLSDDECREFYNKIYSR